jgi:uncharacterized protein YecE (DUF72 family)
MRANHRDTDWACGLEVQGLGRSCLSAPAPRGFDALAYIADYFTSVEINSSYYGPPRPATAQKWLRSVSHNSQFRFTAKLFHSFTHERKPGPDDERDFKSGIGHLLEAGRLARFSVPLIPNTLA